jgi:hypothetical protein
MAYNHSRILSASVWSRPKQSGVDIFGHWGVVVDVEGHGSFLLHNTPESGTVATPTSNMSTLWSLRGKIPVSGTKTIRGAMQASGGAATNYISNAIARYITGYTCVGTAARIAEYLVL